MIITCVILLFVQKRSLEKELSIIRQKAARSEDGRIQERGKVRVLESNVILAAQSTGKAINSKIQLTDVNNKKRTTTEIFAGKTPVLVFRYSPQGCSPCINTTFEHLGRLKESVGSNKLRIIVIPNNMDLRQMVVEGVHPLKSQFDFYLADENGLGLPGDEMLVSYLSIVDGGKTSNVFVVDSMFLPLLERHINALIEVYK